MTTSMPDRKRRWDPYFMRHGHGFGSFWRAHLGDRSRDLLYVVGRGFDPRMCAGLAAVLAAGGAGRRDILLIDFDEGGDSPSRQHGDLADLNFESLNKLLEDRGDIKVRSMAMWSNDGLMRRRVGSRNAAMLLSLPDIQPYSDVVIDVSALPRSVYFALIGKALYLLESLTDPDSRACPINLHVIVTEDPALDRRIRDVGVDDAAHYIHGFSGDMDLEGSAEVPRVWFPILGESQHNKYERVHDLVNPREISPVMPSLVSNPRRGDDLLVEYQPLLFDQWRIDPGNIIYAAERNPFEAYRQITRAVRHYQQALEPLGGCRVAISALSSKLLSIGALLAAHESKAHDGGIAIAHIEAHGHEMTTAPDATSAGELFSLWLAGEAYEL